MRGKPKKRQVNVDLTENRHEILMHFAERTESMSTNGLNKGEPSIGAFVRRVCEGKIQIYYHGKRVDIPFRKFLEILDNQ
jgi:hypothetical protein